MPSPILTRRALLAGAGTAVASTALAVPYMHAVRADDAETITDKLDRLTSELSEVMAEYMGGRFQVVVEPGMDGDVTFVRIDAVERRAFHLAEYKRASEELDPMIRNWTDFNATDTCGGGSVAFRITGQYIGDGIYEGGAESFSGKRIQYRVDLRPGELIDGERTFRVSCPGDRMILTEGRLETFIGCKLA